MECTYKIKYRKDRGSEIIENQVPHLKDLNETPRQSKMKFLLHEEFFSTNFEEKNWSPEKQR